MRLRALVVLVVLALACLAPAPGDIGGCGSEPAALNLADFARERKQEDCTRCRECGLSTTRCTRACDPASASDTGFPKTCEPLNHDGRVCIRALAAASCDDYATYVADIAPALPGECEFCKLTANPVVPPSFGDAGTDGAVP